MNAQRHISRMVASVAMLITLGCASKVEPRVIAERVFPGEQLAIKLTTYPGQPTDGITVTDVQPGPWSDGFDVQTVRPTRVEDLPAIRIDLLAGPAAQRLDVEIRATYNDRRFRISVPFRRREVTLPAEGGRVERWTAGSETVRDLGPCRTPD